MGLFPVMDFGIQEQQEGQEQDNLPHTAYEPLFVGTSCVLFPNFFRHVAIHTKSIGTGTWADLFSSTIFQTKQGKMRPGTFSILK